jgi:hypothetical protein
MKHMIRSLMLLSVVFATAVVHGARPAPGVAGVDVFVKQNPGKRVVTDARGTFAFNALPPGSYTLAFRARAAKDLTRTRGPLRSRNPTDTAAVASSFAIKIEGTKRAVNQSGLTSDKLMEGVDVSIEVGSGATVRGQVVATEAKRMVWIPKEVGSNLAGHWVAADSSEAKGRKIIIHSPDDLADLKGNSNMVDPKDPRNDPNLRGPIPPR